MKNKILTIGWSILCSVGVLVCLLWLLTGCYSYNRYPKGPHKEKVIKITGVVDRQVDVKYE